VLKDETAQLTPIVSSVLDPGVDKEVQHLERYFITFLDLLPVEWRNVAVADTQPRGVKFKLGFFIGGYADSHLVRLVHTLLICVDLAHLVQNGNAVMEPLVQQFGNVLRVQGHLETVADDVCILCYLAAVVEGSDDRDIICGGSLNMDVSGLHRLFQHEGEMR